MANIEIETSTDTVEEVQEALGSSIEIDESPSAEEAEETEEQEEKPAAKPSKGKAEAEEEPEAEESEEGKEGAEGEETPAEEGKEKKGKKPEPMVPRARLNQEIERRKRAEQRAAERAEEPQETKTEKEEPEKRPQFFSGEPEPLLETFMKDVDELDPKAVGKATAAYSKAFAAWSRKEAQAEATYDRQQEEAREAWLDLTEPFVERRDTFVAQYPEYDDIVGKSQVNLTAEQQEFVYESEAGPQILWYFTEHPKEAARIQTLGKRQWSEAMLKVEAIAIKKWPVEAEGEPAEETEEEPVKRTPPPKKPTASKAPLPPNRIKAQGPGPKSLEDLAGPRDRTGVDIEYNPEYERAEKARRGTT